MFRCSLHAELPTPRVKAGIAEWRGAAILAYPLLRAENSTADHAHRLSGMSYLERVEHLGTTPAVLRADGSRPDQKGVGQRALAVIDVRDDAGSRGEGKNPTKEAR